jgi:hypothetical protein
LNSLQHLELEGVAFGPALLAGTTQLTYLRLSEITQWDVSPEDFPPGRTPPAQGRGAYKVLLLLPSLQQLRQLRLDIPTEDWPQAEDQLPAYAALTSNTRLQFLNLQRFAHPLPSTAWKHIFRQELQLPAIGCVGLEGMAPATSEDRVLHCCPVVEAGTNDLGCLDDHAWMGRSLDREGLTPAELQLLEVTDNDPPGVPAVLDELSFLGVHFKGRFHSWNVACFSDPRARDRFLLGRADWWSPTG